MFFFHGSFDMGGGQWGLTFTVFRPFYNVYRILAILIVIVLALTLIHI